MTDDNSSTIKIHGRDVEIGEDLDDDPVFLAVVEWVNGVMKESSLVKHRPKEVKTEVKVEPSGMVDDMDWDDEEMGLPSPQPDDATHREFKITMFV